MEEKYIKYVEDFNEGNVDYYIKIFHSLKNVLKFFKMKNILQYVDPFDSNLDDYQNEILYYLINVIKDEEVLKKTIDQLMDVVFENGEYYLKISDREDLSALFDDRGRGTTARDIVRSVFSEDFWEPYYDTTNDVYTNVIEVLTPENIERLKSYILEVSSNWEIEVDDDSPDLFNNDSKDGVFYITPENVESVVQDKESINYLMNEVYLEDLKYELYNIHNNAYNSAYETEIYSSIMSELETYFDTNSATWESIPSKYNPEKLTEFYVLKFKSGVLKNNITNYLDDHNLWGSYDYNIGYSGSWITMMNNLMDYGGESWLDFRIPDYADWTLTKKYINEMFGDYI